MPARPQLELDAHLKQLHRLAQLLPALTADNGHEERCRLVDAVERGEMPVPRYRCTPRRVPSEAWRVLDLARDLCAAGAAPDLYLRRLEELELDLHMLEALGDARRIRPLAARRFGTGSAIAPTAGGERPVAEVAESLLHDVPMSQEPRVLPADALAGEASLGELVRYLARRAGLEVEVRVEPRLVAGAATGERKVYVADRLFGAREAIRLAVHEVLGHLVAAANGRTQPLRILELGTASSFADQEGVSLCIEEEAGVMDGYRLRTLAARVLATDRMHRGASFGETVRLLVQDFEFTAVDAVAIAERAWRGGGVARDVGYLLGWLRVRAALRDGRTSLDELRSGRVGLDDVPTLRELQRRGLCRPPTYRPTVAHSLGATDHGAGSLTPSRSVEASLSRLELA